MIQDDDFYVILPSNANSNLFPTNTESFYRVALPRQIHLKDEEDWEVGLHHIIYLFSWFEVPHECDHPHLLIRKFGTQKVYPVTLPVGRYQTALDIVEGMLKCMNPQYFKVSVDNEWNITFTTHDIWIMVATPVAQGLGWITSENKILQSDLLGLKIHSSSEGMPVLEYHWCVLPLQSSISFSGTFLVPSSVSLCHCRHKVVQVQTNLIEPRQVGEKRLQLLHEMVPNGLFREMLMEEPGRVNYFLSQTKTFQTIDIYLTSGCGELLSFQGGIVNVTLHFRRHVR